MNAKRRQLKSRVLQKMSTDAVRLLRLAEVLEPEIFLSCDRWAISEAVRDLTWVAEYFATLSAHLKGKALDDDHGYWIDDKSYREVRLKNTGRLEQSKLRKLRPGESVLARNRAEFEAAVGPSSQPKPRRRKAARRDRSRKS